ncbi:signal recognition particle protein, partial [bacterium]|nr:signal recognition particle protein [candidate division CSSED10-310 bacterium]
FDLGLDQDPVEISRQGKEYALRESFDSVILDTAGRLHIDQALMEELKNIKKTVAPIEILLVADAMTGQDAVNIAESFNNDLDLTGVVLTKLDGDARGGAALSIKSVTGRPIKLVGLGEKLDPLEPFHPDRMASRILGMGDVLSLIEKAESTISEDKRKEMEKKFLESSFTLDDFRDQLLQLKKMGSFEQILQMIPGMGKLSKMQGAMPSENDIKQIEAMICSMTQEERRNHKVINTSRRRRIALGSGTDIADVNRLIKQFEQARKMMKNFKKSGKFGRLMQRQKSFFQ